MDLRDFANDQFIYGQSGGKGVQLFNMEMQQTVTVCDMSVLQKRNFGANFMHLLARILGRFEILTVGSLKVCVF